MSFGSPVSSHSEGVSSATNEPLVNSFSGVTVTLSLSKLTECGVDFMVRLFWQGTTRQIHLESYIQLKETLMSQTPHSFLLMKYMERVFQFQKIH